MAFVNIRASSNLHGGALRSVLNAPTSFFDVTPIGRVISRFSKDLHTMDTELGKCEFLNLFFCFFCLFALLTIKNIYLTLSISYIFDMSLFSSTLFFFFFFFFFFQKKNKYFRNLS